MLKCLVFTYELPRASLLTQLTISSVQHTQAWRRKKSLISKESFALFLFFVVRVSNLFPPLSTKEVLGTFPKPSQNIWAGKMTNEDIQSELSLGSPGWHSSAHVIQTQSKRCSSCHQPEGTAMDRRRDRCSQPSTEPRARWGEQPWHLRSAGDALPPCPPNIPLFCTWLRLTCLSKIHYM